MIRALLCLYFCCLPVAAAPAPPPRPFQLTPGSWVWRQNGVDHPADFWADGWCQVGQMGSKPSEGRWTAQKDVLEVVFVVPAKNQDGQVTQELCRTRFRVHARQPDGWYPCYSLVEGKETDSTGQQIGWSSSDESGQVRHVNPWLFLRKVEGP